MPTEELAAVFDETQAGLRITTIRDDRTSVLTLSGELDPLTAPTLSEHVGAALADPDVEALVFDLGAVSFIDSSGLRVLIAAKKAMQEKDGDLEIRNATPKTYRLLQITGLDTFLEVAP